MKKIFLLYILIIGLTSCEKVLEKNDLSTIEKADIWKNADIANLFLNDLYGNSMPTFAGTSNTDLSDESTGSGTDDMMYGNLTASSPYGIYGVNTYNNILDINIMIDGLRYEASFDQVDIDLINGQSFMLRAIEYWDLIKLYGGVPIIKSPLDPYGGESLKNARSSAKECIEFIISDLDTAISLLPKEWDDANYGRLTRGAAAALKGRILLFYASPQFNPNNLAERWQAAYDANKFALELCKEDGYELNPDYSRIFLDEAGSKENIMVTVYDGINRLHGYENTARPGSENNSSTSGSNPSWTHVKAYPMKDGYAIGDASGSYTYNQDRFWENRDPRFKQNIAYNGCKWGLSNQSDRKQWNYFGSKSESISRTTTGFYLRKNVNEAIEKAETPYGATDWVEIRLAEVMLNLAECAAELGGSDKLQEAKELLIEIRDRAGIEAGDGNYGVTANNSADMVDAVLWERQIELCFENKRHWDLRRRNLFADKINGTRRTGISISLNYPDNIDPTNPRQTIPYINQFNTWVDTISDLDENYDQYFVTEYDVEKDGVDINFLQPTYNFYFIPQSDLDKNDKLRQTIHWGEVEPFDPLAN